MLLALISTSLVLAVRFFAERNDRRVVAVDAVLVAVIAWVLWNADSRAKTVYEVFGSVALLVATLLSIVVRWQRARNATGSDRSEGL